MQPALLDTPRASGTETGRNKRRVALLKKMGLFGDSQCSVRADRATNVADLAAAYHLVHEAFVDRGYIRPMQGRLRLRVHEASPNTATFIGRWNGEVVGVQSLIVDSDDLGLPSDRAFGKEIDEYRSGQLRVCEVANQAIASEHRKTGLPTELMRCCFAHALSVGCDELITTVSPGHARFYELLGFERISPIRSFSDEVDDPTVVVGMDLTALGERVRALAAGRRTVDSFLYAYYIEGNPYHRHVADWRKTARCMFTDLTMLHDLFVTRSGLLDRCTTHELDAISRRWGPDIFNQVATRPTRGPATLGAA